MEKEIFSKKLERQKIIHDKGFVMTSNNRGQVVDYAQVRIGNGPHKKASDVSVNLQTALSAVDSAYTDKQVILTAIRDKDAATMREISDFYFETSGVYKRAVEYLAKLYRYDYYLVPHISRNGEADKKKVLKIFDEALNFIENSSLRKLFSSKALEVIKYGCYYGYRIESKEKIILQDLPVEYCRSKYFINGKPTVEFNMKFFDDKFRDSGYRQKILDIFPSDFNKGYRLYKSGQLPPEQSGEENSWYMLDPKYAVKFNLNDSDMPYLINAIPAIIDLDEAQEIDRKRMLQQLMKILIQKLPLDKNGDLIFDVEEGKDLHRNAVDMLSKTLGVEVLTTFADIDVKDMDTTTSITSKADALSKVERTVYNTMGISKNVFNTEGNTALDKSILDDEASVKDFLFQFQDFANEALEPFNKNKKKCELKLKILETTIYNYKELSKLYKEQVQLGYSKLLPQLALGHSQKEILAELTFENDILELSKIMIPAQSSSQMSSDALDKLKKSDSNNNQKIIEEKKSGRKELPDDQKSDKTLANREALG